MKIGIDARMYRSSVAGIGRYSQNLIKNLLEVDRDDEFVLFMTSKDKQEFDKLVIENSLKIENCKLKIVTVDIPHYSLAEQTKLPKIIEKEKCDLVHFLNFNYPIKYKGKFVVTIHDLTLFFYPDTARETSWIKKIAFNKIFKSAVENAEKVIAVSKNTKRDIVKKFKVKSEKIEIIYEAADDPTLPRLRGASKKVEIRKKYKITKPIILYVGQFRKHKNVEGLLKAYKILKKSIACRLVLVGNVPQVYNSMIDNDPDLRDTLRPGFVSDGELAAWYEASDVFCFPSFYEGFGLPGIEAMQAKTPVVASKVSSLPEIYQDAAIYFDPSNPVDISDKIKLVINNKKLREKLVQKGREIAKLYSWKKTAQETLKVYQEIQSQKSK